MSAAGATSPHTVCADAVAGVRSLLDLDPTLLDDAEVQRFAIELSRLSDVVAVAQAAWVGEWEARGAWRADGSRSASLALSREAKCSPGHARRVLARGHAVANLPATVEGVLEGRLSIDHFDVIRGLHQRAVSAEWLQHLESSESRLVDECADHRLFDDARRALLGWAAELDDRLGLPPALPVSAMSRARDRVVGTLRLEGELSAIDAEIVEAELRRLEREVVLDDRRAGVVRTASQRTAAALVRMAARSQGATGVGTRPLFQVIAGDQRVRNLLQLASGAVLSERQVLPYLDTATFETFLFDGPLRVVAVSQRRTFTGALRRAVQVRDRRCRHDSVCDVAAVDADVDHLVPAAEGGPTSQFNGAVGCWAHNRLSLGGTKPPPMPEQSVDVLDVIRARVRWNMAQQTPEEVRAISVQWHLDAINQLFGLDDEFDGDVGLDAA